MAEPRVAVVGAGAVGSVFGVGFARAGLDTTLVDVSRPLIEKIRSDGLTLIRAGEEITVRPQATWDPALVGTRDAVFFLVKGHQTRSAAELARPLVGDGTAVVTLQNGWGNAEVLANVFGPARVVAGVTYHSATVVGLGRVDHTGVGPTYIGPFRGASPAICARPEEALRRTGMEVKVLADIATAIWKKLIVNAAELPPSALTGLRIAGLGEAPIAELVEAVAAEAVAVARAAGYDIELTERIEVIKGTIQRGGQGKPSMLQDVDAGRRTEIETVTGAVIAEADRLGIAVPINRTLYALVKGLERARQLAEGART